MFSRALLCGIPKQDLVRAFYIGGSGGAVDDVRARALYYLRFFHNGQNISAKCAINSVACSQSDWTCAEKGFQASPNWWTFEAAFPSAFRDFANRAYCLFKINLTYNGKQYTTYYNASSC